MWLIVASVLPRSNVLNLHPREWKVLLTDAAVLTAIASADANCFPQRSVHFLDRRYRVVRWSLATTARAFACRIPIMSMAST